MPTSLVATPSSARSEGKQAATETTPSRSRPLGDHWTNTNTSTYQHPFGFDASKLAPSSCPPFITQSQSTNDILSLLSSNNQRVSYDRLLVFYAIIRQQLYTIQLMFLPHPSDYNKAPFLAKPMAPSALVLRHDHFALDLTTFACLAWFVAAYTGQQNTPAIIIAVASPSNADVKQIPSQQLP